MQRMPTLSETEMSLFELKTRYVRNYLTFSGKNSNPSKKPELLLEKIRQGDISTA